MLLAVSVVGLLYAPFLERNRLPTGSLSTYLERFRFNDPIFTALERVANAHLAAGLAIFLGLLTAAWLRRTQPECSWEAWAWPMAVSLACAPVLYPWYLLWLVPFLGTASTLPLMVWSLSILFTYFVWYLERFGHPWRVPAWVMLLEFGSVLLAGVIVWLRRTVTVSKLSAAAQGTRTEKSFARSGRT
jgi:hypothetical protein